jgi:hypothetical protein
MKKLLMTSALALGIASPALAQSFDASIGSGNLVQPGWSYGADIYEVSAYEAFVRQRVANPYRAHASWYAAHAQVRNGWFAPHTLAVYGYDGRYLGADPDLRIRQDLYRTNGLLD